jgi:hypothetical protein
VRSVYSPSSVFRLLPLRVDFFLHLHIMEEVSSLRG